MKRKTFLPIIFGSVLLLAGCSYGSQNTAAPSGTSVPSVPSGQNQNQSAPEATGNVVTIQNFAFNPASLTIKAGTTVTWTNKDSATHTVTSSSFNSGNIAPDGKFQFTFATPGTYAYSCGIHPSMKGTIIVQ